MKLVLKPLAFLFLFLGTLGIFLPLLPTVPFYLLALLLLLKLSKREVVKLRKLPLFGRFVYPHIKRSARFLRRWTTQQPSSSI